MFKQQILEDLQKAAKDLGFPSTDIVLSSSKNSDFGDYSTNVALQLAKLELSKDKQTPEEIANKIIEKLLSFDSAQDNFKEIKVAGGGFINFFLKDEELIKYLEDVGKFPNSSRQKILVEYGHTNPLKEVHIGHLRTFILGEALCRIFESLGNQVFRANYQGDIGLHIAKAVWGIEKLGLPSKSLSLEEKAKYMGRAYAEGNLAYEEEEIKKEIEQINASLYNKEEEFKKIYDLVRDWSLAYFEPIYELLGIKYNRCFFESEVYEEGKEIVLENLGSPRSAGGAGKVFEKSNRAIIFPGEKFGLHNRVFVTKLGHATYEGKEVGLAELEYSTFNYDQAIHVVAHEQAGYFKVVFAAIEKLFPNLKDKKYHLSYGLVDLKEGKMSSRTGSVVTVDDLYKVVSEKVREVMKGAQGSVDQDTVRKIAMGAIKFSYLKFSPAPNMVFDLEESVSLEGDSGPYVQYTYARIQSVLAKAKGQNLRGHPKGGKLNQQERMILRQLLYFPDIVEEAAKTYHPNLLTGYLIETARFYNLFYQNFRILESDRVEFRLKLSASVAQTLKKGLYLLGIEAPERM